jgi:hypothetical protein
MISATRKKPAAAVEKKVVKRWLPAEMLWQFAVLKKQRAISFVTTLGFTGLVFLRPHNKF